MTRPIRILELRSVRGTGGGPEKTILLGTAQSDRARYAITVCYLRDLRDTVFQIERRAQELQVDYVEIRERHSLDPGIWEPLRELIRNRQIDIIHSHDYKTDFLALALAWFEPTVPLATAHGWAGHSFKERRFYYPIDRRLLARFPRVIVVSADIRDALVRVGAAPERITVIPNGIDHVTFRRNRSAETQARRTLGFADADVVIGTVGRLQAEKNFRLLLRTFAELLPANPKLRLVVAGDGPLRAELERLVLELGIGSRCALLGHVDDVISLHHALDVFVMCSDNEGSPNAVLEAMAMETPIVATAVGGIPDLVRHRREALLVPRRDATALAAAISECVYDREAALTRASAARKRIEQDLSFARRMEKVEGIYDALLQQYADIRKGRRWWQVRPGRAQ